MPRLLLLRWDCRLRPGWLQSGFDGSSQDSPFLETYSLRFVLSPGVSRHDSLSACSSAARETSRCYFMKWYTRIAVQFCTVRPVYLYFPVWSRCRTLICGYQYGPQFGGVSRCESLERAGPRGVISAGRVQCDAHLSILFGTLPGANTLPDARPKPRWGAPPCVID